LEEAELAVDARKAGCPGKRRNMTPLVSHLGHLLPFGDGSKPILHYITI
jgi:hypothetical protein